MEKPLRSRGRAQSAHKASLEPNTVVCQYCGKDLSRANATAWGLRTCNPCAEMLVEAYAENEA